MTSTPSPWTRYESADWLMSRALMAAEASAPELIAHFGIDLDDLAGHDQLLPLDDFLAADPDFDAGAFWPGALETGQREGVQYGLPFALSPDFTFVNGELATERGHRAAGTDAASLHHRRIPADRAGFPRA